MSNGKLKYSDILQFVYFFYITIKIIGVTQVSLIAGWQSISRTTNYVTIIVLALIAFGRKEKSVWMLFSVVLIAVGIIISFSNDNFTGTLILVLFIINGKVFNIEEYETFLIKYVKIVSTILAATIILSLLGVFYSDYKLGYDGKERQYFGFLAATHSANYFFHVVLVYIASKKSQITVKESIVVLLANYFLYQGTFTRAVFYYINGLIVLLWLIRFFPRIIQNRFTTFIFSSVIPVGAFSSILLSMYYNPNNFILYKLNELLTHRLSLGQKAINQYGISLFGTEVQWITGRYGIERFTDYLYVDSAYVNLAINYGAVILVFFVIGFTLMMLKSQKQGSYYQSVSLLFLGIHSFSDPQLFDLRYNPFLLFLFGTLIYFYKTRPVTWRRKKITNRMRTTRSLY